MIIEKFYELALKEYEKLLEDNKIFASEQVKDAFIQGYIRGYQTCYSYI